MKKELSGTNHNDTIDKYKKGEERFKGAIYVQPIKEEAIKVELPVPKTSALTKEQIKERFTSLENNNIKANNNCCQIEKNYEGSNKYCQMKSQMQALKLKMSLQEKQIASQRHKIEKSKQSWENKLAITHKNFKTEIENQKLISEKLQKSIVSKDFDIEILKQDARSQHLEITTFKSLIQMKGNEFKNLKMKHNHQTKEIEKMSAAKKEEMVTPKDQSNIQPDGNNIAMLQEKLNKQNIEISNFKKMISVLVQDIDSLKSVPAPGAIHKGNNRQIQNSEILKKEVSVQMDEIKSLKSEIEAKDTELESLQIQNKYQEGENQSLHQALETYEEEENTKLNAQFVLGLAKDLKIAEMTKKIGTLDLNLQLSKEDFKNLLQNLHFKIKTLEEQTQQKEIETTQKEKVQDTEIETLNQQQETSNSVKELLSSNNLNQTNQAQSNKVLTLELGLGRLQVEKDHFKEINEANRDLNNVIESCKQKLDMIQKENAHLKSIYKANQNQDKEIYVLKLQLRELQIENELLRRNINNSNQTNQEQRKEIYSLEQVQEESKIHNEQLITNINILYLSNHEQNKEVESLKQNLEELQKENEHLKSVNKAFQDLKDDIESFKQQLEESQLENKLLNNNNVKMIAQLESNETELALTKKEHKNLILEKSEIQQQLISKSKELKLLNKKLILSKARFQIKVNEWARLQNSNELKYQKISEQNITIEKLNLELNECKAKENEVIKSKAEINSKLIENEAEIEALNNKLNSVQNQYHKTMVKIKSLETQNERIGQMIKDHSTETDNLIKSNQDLSKQLNEKKREIELLKENIITYKNQGNLIIKNMKEQLVLKIKELSECKRVIDKLSQKIN